MQENTAVQIDQLCFGFPRQPLLFDNLNLAIPQGSTFGILGPNGAGKSTLIKMAIGLVPFKNGTIHLFGKKLLEHRQKILQQIGYLIEGPRLYTHLSGMDNLRVFATYRHLAKQKLPGLLDEVGLAPHADKLVRHYSTGMKQRLAIAVAMMHAPTLLILDEPTNGLDPQGIAEIRELIFRLKNKPDCTIIFCSHILSEVQQICGEVGILHNGQIVFQGSTQALHHDPLLYLLETDAPQQATGILKKWKSEIREKGILIYLNNPDEINSIIDLLRNAGVRIFQIKKIENNLESTYLQFVKK